ncbi:Uncharacterised protein [BD1-7 clade bacterium]|uniref:Nucleotide-diphospho-sugar transferase domain-containing protein n=1 Tax=BD1-7 clade bacterium TaxID=2029982 RepID=A0A5S9NS28_9GAMM|nr:Uncharacterised protein [BD1-7 clade bacterium]CAA0093370.1 Uncharacterised protein [BD1-7 clade bacterium]
MQPDWLRRCMFSVEAWAENSDYEYRFVDDSLFDLVDSWVLEKTQEQRVIATDIARLKLIQQSLARGYDQVVWIDADFLIFEPSMFELPPDPSVHCAVGREVWIQEDVSTEAKPAPRKRFRAYRKVHNAFMVFRRGDSFLNFYCDTAERLLFEQSGSVPPQFIGPKLLTALHNVVQLPVAECAGMLSPDTSKAILYPNGPGVDTVLSLFSRKSHVLPAGANLCSSLNGNTALSQNVGFSDREMLLLVDRLLNEGRAAFQY